MPPLQQRHTAIICTFFTTPSHPIFCINQNPSLPPEHLAEEPIKKSIQSRLPPILSLPNEREKQQPLFEDSKKEKSGRISRWNIIMERKRKKRESKKADDDPFPRDRSTSGRVRRSDPFLASSPLTPLP